MSQELQIKLQTVRKQLKITQKSMAEKLGCPLRTLIGWENNQRTPRGFALTALMQRLEEMEKS